FGRPIGRTSIARPRPNQSRPVRCGGRGRFDASVRKALSHLCCADSVEHSDAMLNDVPRQRAHRPGGLFCWMLMAPAMFLLAGCATPPRNCVGTPRPFNFEHDSFAYSNQLVWEYHHDEHGKWVSHAREPKPDYTHHCFVVARSARQFFEY